MPTEQNGPDLRERLTEWLPLLMTLIGLTGTVIVTTVWLIFNRPEPVLLATFGSFVSGGLMTVAIQEVKGLRDDIVKERRRGSRRR